MPISTTSELENNSDSAIADWESNQDWARERKDTSRSSLRSSSSKTTSDMTSSLETRSETTKGSESPRPYKDKSSWVKTIGIRTLRLRKNSEKTKSRDLNSLSSSGGNYSPKPASVSSGTPPPEVNKQEQSGHVKARRSGSGVGSSTNGSTSKEKAQQVGIPDKQDPARFIGEGLSFKAKLIGVLEVSGPRGDTICQQALSELKMAVKAAGEHKQKITIHIALDGLKIRDEKTGESIFHHHVHKISFIAQDLTDGRAFGYIFGSPDTGHRFFGIKTEKSASQVVIAMRDLFQVVFDLKKKEIERAKQQLELQQKFLATRAAETTAPKLLEHQKSIAETYIEGAASYGSTPLSSSQHKPQEVDLLNLEVELNRLEEGLENIHHNLVDSGSGLRGSTASISSDTMSQQQQYNTCNSTNKGSSPSAIAASMSISSSTPTQAIISDPFGDSFDPFESAAGGNDNSNNSMTYQKFGNSASALSSPFGLDPFSQIDPFSTGIKFGDSGDFFGNSDPFENAAAAPTSSQSAGDVFNFESDGSNIKSIDVPLSRGGINNSTNSSTKLSRFDSNNSQTSIGAISNERVSSADEIGAAAAANNKSINWTASFDDNFVPGEKSTNLSSSSSTHMTNGLTNTKGLDIFTELDPLGIGRFRPFVDRKDFFQDLKNPPKKMLNDFSAISSLGGGGGADISPKMPSSTFSELTPPHSSTSSTASPSTKVQTTCPSSSSSNNNNNNSQLPNSFSSNFAPLSSFGSSSSSQQPHNYSDFETHFKSPSSVSSLSKERSISPPNYSPPPPPPPSGSVTNTEYFTTILPPLGSSSSSSHKSVSSSKRSPQILKQMTILTSSNTSTTSTSIANNNNNFNNNIISNSNSSPKTLPRTCKLGRNFTIDSTSGREYDEIPNLTPPPRPPMSGTLGKFSKQASCSSSSAVPRPTSTIDRMKKNRDGGGGSSFSSSCAPEPPPRPPETTLSPPPPLPPKKQNPHQGTFGPVISTSNNKGAGSSSSELYTEDSISKGRSNNVVGRSVSSESSNDLPLPLPSRKSTTTFTTTGIGRYGYPPLATTIITRNSPQLPRKNNSDAIPPPPPSSRNNNSSSSSSVVVVSQNNVEQNKSSGMTLEQALGHVASLSFGQLASKLNLPVEHLSSFTIQQLAEKFQTLSIGSVAVVEPTDSTMEAAAAAAPASNNPDLPNRVPTNSTKRCHSVELGFESNFEDDFSFSAATAPPVMENETNNFDKYAVFRELALEEASGFSVTSGSVKSLASWKGDDEESTLENNRDSSSERTLHASEQGNPSLALGAGNSTMDDITDVNMSDEDGRESFRFDDDDDDNTFYGHGAGQNEWATFDSYFDEFHKKEEMDKATMLENNPPPSLPNTSSIINTTITTINNSSISSSKKNQQMFHIELKKIEKKIPQDSSSSSSEDEIEQEKVRRRDNNEISIINNSSINNNVVVDEDEKTPMPYNYNKENLDDQFGSETFDFDITKFTQPTNTNFRKNSHSHNSANEVVNNENTLNSPHSSAGKFTRQSSGSSRHSGGGGGGGYGLEFSDSGEGCGGVRKRTRKRSNELLDQPQPSINREDRGGSGRRSKNQDPPPHRSDSRNSESSRGRGGSSRSHQQYDSEEEYNRNPASSSSKYQYRNSTEYRGGSGRRSKRLVENDYDDMDEEEDDTRSYASNHSAYSSSSSHNRKRKSGSGKYYHHSYHDSRQRRSSGGSGHHSSHYHHSRGKQPYYCNSNSPDRCSNRESDDFDSFEEDGGRSICSNVSSASLARKRERDYFQRERDYLERHHRLRPNSGGSGTGSGSRRGSRPQESPRSSRRQRYKRGGQVEEDYDGTREGSDNSDSNSKCQQHQSSLGGSSSISRRHGKKHMIRKQHQQQKDYHGREYSGNSRRSRDSSPARQSQRDYYYNNNNTNSPSCTSESPPQSPSNNRGEQKMSKSNYNKSRNERNENSQQQQQQSLKNKLETGRRSSLGQYEEMNENNSDRLGLSMSNIMKNRPKSSGPTSSSSFSRQKSGGESLKLSEFKRPNSDQIDIRADEEGQQNHNKSEIQLEEELVDKTQINSINNISNNNNCAIAKEISVMESSSSNVNTLNNSIRKKSDSYPPSSGTGESVVIVVKGNTGNTRFPSNESPFEDNFVNNSNSHNNNNNTGDNIIMADLPEIETGMEGKDEEVFFPTKFDCRNEEESLEDILENENDYIEDGKDLSKKIETVDELEDLDEDEDEIKNEREESINSNSNSPTENISNINVNDDDITNCIPAINNTNNNNSTNEKRSSTIAIGSLGKKCIGEGGYLIGKRLESIRSEEERLEEEDQVNLPMDERPQMKKSDSFNIFQLKEKDPFADDDFFA